MMMTSRGQYENLNLTKRKPSHYSLITPDHFTSFHPKPQYKWNEMSINRKRNKKHVKKNHTSFGFSLSIPSSVVILFSFKRNRVKFGNAGRALLALEGEVGDVGDDAGSITRPVTEPLP